MPKGFSIHIGVNRVEAPGFSFTSLKGCENDAITMHQIARAQTPKFESNGPILTKDATFKRIDTEIENAAKVLNAGDILLLTFAGHGTREAAVDLEGEEDDLQDETIVLFDSVVLDTVFLRLFWPRFRQGVRILAISDSCHSGTSFFIPGNGGLNVSEMNQSAEQNRETEGEDGIVSDGSGPVRTVPDSQTARHLDLRKEFYAEIRAKIAAAKDPILANILTIGACKDRQKTHDGQPHGVFTQALLDVWNKGGFTGDHRSFRNAIEKRLPKQTPVLVTKFADADFIAQRPFTI